MRGGREGGGGVGVFVGLKMMIVLDLSYLVLPHNKVR